MGIILQSVARVKDASVNYGSNEFWDTGNQYGSTTKCAAKVFNDQNRAVSDAE